MGQRAQQRDGEAGMAGSGEAPKVRRVVVVDDDRKTHWLVRDALQRSEDFQCAACHSSTTSALVNVPLARPEPDLLLLDLRLLGRGGISAARQFTEALPRVKILALTARHDMESVQLARHAGAGAFLVKPVRESQLLAALRFVAADTGRVDGRELEPADIACPAALAYCPMLTPRQNDVMRLLAQGFYCKEIADKLGISFSAVHKHLHHSYRTLSVNNRFQAALRWQDLSDLPALPCPPGTPAPQLTRQPANGRSMMHGRQGRSF